MKKILFALFASSLFWTGCYDHFKTTYENIVGTYHYEGDWNDRIDLYTLEILPDSTFITKYRKKPADSIQIWEGKIIIRQGGGAEIVFDVWYDLPNFRERPQPGRSYKVTYFFDRNKIEFSTDPDMREHFFVRDKKL